MKNGFYLLSRVPPCGHKLCHRTKLPDKSQTINNAKIRENLSKYFGPVVLRIDQKCFWQQRIVFTCEPIIEALNNCRLCQCAVMAILAPFLKNLANSNSVLGSALLWQFGVIRVKFRQFAQVIGNQHCYELFVDCIKAGESSAVVKNLPI